jgi:hypothetical protein
MVLRRVVRKILRTVAPKTAHASDSAKPAANNSAKPAEEKPTHVVEYSSLIPAPQNPIALFTGAWTSKLPGYEGAGTTSLFEDLRISWLLERLGNLNGWRVLELGPLEAGHTYMLENSGAHVVAIEANHYAFLRCLVVKNLFNLKSQFLLGDFAKSFGSDDKYDLIVASGVLYHMMEPVALIQRLAKASDRLFFWTHYFDGDVSRWNEKIRDKVGSKWRPDLTKTVKAAGINVRIVPQVYGHELGCTSFCGGPETSSYWIYREDFLGLLKTLGFGKIEIAFESPDHVNGPSFCVLAQRS